MEPGTAGEYSERFSIGNADSANALIQTMKDLEAFVRFLGLNALASCILNEISVGLPV